MVNIIEKTLINYKCRPSSILDLVYGGLGCVREQYGDGRWVLGKNGYHTTTYILLRKYE